MRNCSARSVLKAKINSKTRDTVVTMATATNGSGIILSACLRNAWEIVEISAAVTGKRASTSRQLLSPTCFPAISQRLPTIRIVLRLTSGIFY